MILYISFCIRFQQPVVSKLEINNTGKSIVHWHFMPKLEEQRVSKQWIELSADSGLLLPGEVGEARLLLNIFSFDSLILFLFSPLE